MNFASQQAPRVAAEAYFIFSAEKNPKRKEVTAMEYKKPQIGTISEALDLIQSDGMKNHSIVDGGTVLTSKTTVPAYEADE